MTCQPLWVILCCLPEKGRREIEKIVEEMKRGAGEKEENEWKWRNRRNKNIPPPPLPAEFEMQALPTCPTVSQYQLGALVM